MKKENNMTVSYRQQAEDAILTAAEKWPSEFLSREDVRTFSGNSISIGYLANLDCQGKGPAGCFYLGRRLVYPKKSAVEWLIGRMRLMGRSFSQEAQL